MKIKFKKMDEKAIVPSFGNDDFSNAAVDLYACLPSGIRIIPAGGTMGIPTGIAWEPVGGGKYAMLIQSRSGTAFKNHVEASNAGVVDHSYRGEIMVKLYNNSNRDFVVEHGHRIAQGIILDLPYITEIVEAKELSPSVRGNSGFGSTGR